MVALNYLRNPFKIICLRRLNDSSRVKGIVCRLILLFFSEKKNRDAFEMFSVKSLGKICIFIVLVLLPASQAAPFSWQAHDLGYDASLDPIVWSRNFVQESVRKPRRYKDPDVSSNTKISANADGSNELSNEIDLKSSSETLQQFKHAAKNFGKRGQRKSISSWYDDYMPLYQQRKVNSKRRHRLRKKLQKHSGIAFTFK